MKLEALQRAIHDLVRGDRALDDAAGALGVDPRRLALYRDFARGHVRTAVDNVFEITQRLLAERWDTLVDAYTRACPPSHWTLNAAAESFPEFLEGQVGAGGVDPFHVALAQFEWEQYAVLVDEAELTPPGAGARLNPTLSLLESPYPVVPFVVEHLADPQTPTPAPRSAIAMLWRHPTTHNCVYRHGTDDLLLVVKTVHERLPLDRVAEAVGHPIEAIVNLLDQAATSGLILRA